MSEVYKAISAVMAYMAGEGISKTRRNQQQGYSFRGIDDIYAAVGKVMAENKLVIIPRVQSIDREERKTAKGGLLMFTILKVEFDLISAKDDSKHTACTIGEAMDSGDKSANKAQSAALKYAALQIFMIPTEGDNDADATTHDVVADKPDDKPQTINEAQWTELTTKLEATNSDVGKFLKEFKCRSVKMLLRDDYGRAMSMLEKKEEKMRAEAEKAVKPEPAPFDDLDEDSIPY